MNEQIRAEFEQEFLPPHGCVYNAEMDHYGWISHPKNEHPFNAQYETWQASHARYTGSGEMVTCGCGDMFPHNSYDAGWIHAVGCCPNCHVADSPPAQPKVPDRAAIIELLTATSK
jgi:hypothetical protein